MNIKNRVRKITFSILNDKQIDLFYKMYYSLRYHNEMQKVKSFGKLNEDKAFYIIRPRKDCIEGLLSLFWNVIRNIEYAKENGYIPIVDFKNFNTQYKVNKEDNVWEYYFTQPSNVLLDEVYQSKNVILSGLDIQWYKKNEYKPNYDLSSLKKIHSKIFENIDFSNEVKNRVKREIENLNMDMSNSLGLYLRGTDYTKLKPSGHPVQPTVLQATEIVDSYIKKYNIKSIFLVTEDGEIHDSIKAKYGDMCVTPSFDTYIYSYIGDKFLSNDSSINDLGCSPYERGMNYLVKMIILSKCSYLVGGNTNGMWATCAFSDSEDIKRYIFDLGVYGK